VTHRERGLHTQPVLWARLRPEDPSRTYGLAREQQDGPAIRVSRPEEVYARDEFVYWGFGAAGLERLARIAGFSEVGALDCVQVAGHPRIIGRLIA
jgi:hypothetical protein